MKDKSIQEFIAILEKYYDTYAPVYSAEEIASIVAKALVDFLPYVDKR